MITVSAVTVFAPAKVNLFLHVGERRGDGYHALQSLVVFADVGDEISLSAADNIVLSIQGPFAARLAGEGDNLVVKAARVLAQKAGVRAGAGIALTKNLPVASGIGGGSADAAATLRGLSRLWDLNVTDDDLRSIAAQLGSDVPVCIASVAAWMEGRGEILTPLAELPKIPILLVNPGIAVSTAEVFRALRTRRGADMALPIAPFRNGAELLGFLASTANDLEAPACAIRSIIAEMLRTLDTLPGILLSRMSGSGATCFGVFESEDMAVVAAAAVARAHPDWWVRAANVASGGAAQ